MNTDRAIQPRQLGSWGLRVFPLALSMCLSPRKTLPRSPAPCRQTLRPGIDIPQQGLSIWTARRVDTMTKRVRVARLQEATSTAATAPDLLSQIIWRESYDGRGGQLYWPRIRS